MVEARIQEGIEALLGPRSVMAVPYERKSGEAFNRDAGGSAPEALAMASCCQS